MKFLYHHRLNRLWKEILQLVLGRLLKTCHSSSFRLEYNRPILFLIEGQVVMFRANRFLFDSFLQFTCELFRTNCLQERLCNHHIEVRHWKDHVVWSEVCMWHHIHRRYWSRKLWLAFLWWFHRVTHLRKLELFNIHCRCFWCKDKS